MHFTKLESDGAVAGGRPSIPSIAQDIDLMAGYARHKDDPDTPIDDPLNHGVHLLAKNKECDLLTAGQVFQSFQAGAGGVDINNCATLLACRCGKGDGIIGVIAVCTILHDLNLFTNSEARLAV